MKVQYKGKKKEVLINKDMDKETIEKNIIEEKQKKIDILCRNKVLGFFYIEKEKYEQNKEKNEFSKYYKSIQLPPVEKENSSIPDYFLFFIDKSFDINLSIEQDCFITFCINSMSEDKKSCIFIDDKEYIIESKNYGFLDEIKIIEGNHKICSSSDCSVIMAIRDIDKIKEKYDICLKNKKEQEKKLYPFRLFKKEPKILLALQYWSGDEQKAYELSRFIADLEDSFNNEAIFLFSRRFDTQPPSENLIRYMSKKFKVLTYISPTEAKNHPYGCNILWENTVEHVSNLVKKRKINIDSIFTFEPDCLPIKKDWIKRIHAEWKEKKCLVLGSLIYNHSIYDEHINGNMIVSPMLPCFVDLHTAGRDQGWDLYYYKHFKYICKQSKEIYSIYANYSQLFIDQNIQNIKNMAKNYDKEELYIYRRFDPCILHGIKNNKHLENLIEKNNQNKDISSYFNDKKYEKEKISLAITTYNEFYSRKTIDILNQNIAIAQADDRIQEIVISDDCSKDFNILHRIYFGQRKIKIYKNEKNLGVFGNKKMAVKRCSSEWVILFDSDNLISKNYVDVLYQEKWNKNVIYCPSFARPIVLKNIEKEMKEKYNIPLDIFDFRKYNNRVFSRKDGNELSDNINMITVGNYFINKNEYLDILKDLPEERFDLALPNYLNIENRQDISHRKIYDLYDAAIFAHEWLKNGKLFKIVPNLSYNHTINEKSYSIINNKDNQEKAGIVWKECKEKIKNLNNKIDYISIILTVHNKDFIIESVIQSIIDNSSELVKEIIIVIDGCTDTSEEKINKLLPKIKEKYIVKIIKTNDVFEVIANNIGLKQSSFTYSCIIQDDMIIQEKDFDKILLKPFLKLDNILCVSGRLAHSWIIENDKLNICNNTEEYTNKNYFYVRDAAVRGPLLIDNDKLKILNYLDEIYAPLGVDDHDLCIRGYINHGWVSGHRDIKYLSKGEWGGTRQPECIKIAKISNEKNELILKEKYRDYFKSPKHDQDILIE